MSVEYACWFGFGMILGSLIILGIWWCYKPKDDLDDCVTYMGRIPPLKHRDFAGQYGGVWGEHPDYPLRDWRYQVENNDTRQGYWDWVSVEYQLYPPKAKEDTNYA